MSKRKSKKNILCKKRKYKDKIKALFILAIFLNSKKGNRNERRIYKCNKCKFWHIASKNRK